jgi:hypothetical protein
LAPETTQLEGSTDEAGAYTGPDPAMSPSWTPLWPREDDTET